MVEELQKFLEIPDLSIRFVDFQNSFTGSFDGKFTTEPTQKIPTYLNIRLFIRKTDNLK